MGVCVRVRVRACVRVFICVVFVCVCVLGRCVLRLLGPLYFFQCGVCCVFCGHRPCQLGGRCALTAGWLQSLLIAFKRVARIKNSRTWRDSTRPHSQAGVPVFAEVRTDNKTKTMHGGTQFVHMGNVVSTVCRHSHGIKFACVARLNAST